MEAGLTGLEARELLAALVGNAERYQAMLRYGTLRTFRPGRHLMCQGDTAEGACLVLDGRFSCRKYRSDESMVPLPALVRGSWAGVAECLNGGTYLYEATAMETSAAYLFSMLNFSALRRQVPSFDSEVLLPALTQDLHGLHGQLADAGPLDRLVSYLLGQRRTMGGVARQRIAISQAELGQAIGCTRETVNKYLGLLSDRGFISLERRCIVILSWEALADYL